MSPLLLLLLSLFGVSQCYSELLQRFFEHKRSVAAHPCGVPTLRAIDAEEIYKAARLEMHRYEIEPPTTLLHRCKSSGCCRTSEERCEAIGHEKVKLVFMVTELGKRLRPIPKVVHMTNHTLCACMTARKGGGIK